MLSVWLLTAVLFGVCEGLQWHDTLPNDVQLPFCSGDEIDLDWHYNLTEGEQLKSIQWNQTDAEDGNTREIASYSENTFKPSSDFSGRVSYARNAGIQLDSATILESGNYSVVVSTERNNTVSEFTKTVIVTIADTPKTMSGIIEVTHEQKAVWDDTTGQWHAELTCGQFSDRGQPPVDVVWTTPDGDKLTSSNFLNNNFHLRLPSPVKGGQYSCGLPSQSPATRCLPHTSALRRDATVDVSAVIARLSLLEAQQIATQTQMEAEDDRLLGLIINQTQPAPPRVSFHARLTSTKTGTGRLQAYTVISNEGNGFSGSNGIFTSPVNATYFILGSSTSTNNGYHVSMELQKEGTRVSFAYAYAYNEADPAATCHAVLHLSVGERVWLHSTASYSFYYADSTYFTGFLIRADDN